MAIKKTTPLLFSIILTVFFLAGCGGSKNNCSHYNSFFLTGGVTYIYPDKDSILVGDTLWFTSAIPIKIKYKNGGNTDSSVYDLSGASGVTTDIHFNSLLGKNNQVGAVDSFEFINGNGKIATNNVPGTSGAVETVSYTELPDNFQLSFGILALKKGVYNISVIDIYQAQKNCDHISISLSESNTNQRLYYLQNVYYGGSQPALVDQTHSFSFKVY